MTTIRTGGIAFAVYGLATFLGFMNNGPGGDYEDAKVVGFMSHGHMWAAFGYGYLGCLGAVALLVAGRHLRDLAGSARDLVWGLAIAGSTASAVGFFVTAGVAVSLAEGGTAVRDSIPHSVVYTFTETGNLLSVCLPALFVGVIALVLARKADLPRWLRVFCVVAGICGILAPFFITYFVYLLWVLVTGAFLALSRGRAPISPRAHESLV
jgi:hypothetical protein